MGGWTGRNFEVGGSEEVGVDEAYGMGWRHKLWKRVWTCGVCGWLSVYPSLFCDICSSFLTFSLSCFVEKVFVSQLQRDGYVETHLKETVLFSTYRDTVNERKRSLQPDPVGLHRTIAVHLQSLASFGRLSHQIAQKVFRPWLTIFSF